MNSKGVFEEASVCQSDIPSRKRGACYEFQCISSSELFAKKIRSKRKWSVSPLRYDWKRASGAPKYHHFQTLTTKKAKNSSQETVHREDTLSLSSHSRRCPSSSALSGVTASSVNGYASLPFQVGLAF